MAITIDGSSGISSVDGSAASPSVRGSDANSGILYTSDAIKFSTGGTQRAFIDNNGLSSVGHILQVQSAKTNNRTEMSSTTWTATNLNANITPTTSSNRVIVQVTGDCNTNDSGNELSLSVFRSINGGTYNNLGNGTYGFMSARSTGARIHTAVSIQFVDDPGTTDQVNYKVYLVRPSGSGANVEFPVNDGHQFAYIHLMELAS